MHKLSARSFLLAVLTGCLVSNPASAAVDSTFPVFWVAGDPVIVANAFKAVAAFFGDGDTASSMMQGAMASAALVGLLIALVSSVIRSQFLVGQWFVGTVVAIAMFQPTTTITVKSYFDENSAMVSPRMVIVEKVPVGIAYPAGMASFATKAMSDKFLQWFAPISEDPDDGAQVAGAGGLMNPLKMLLRLNNLYDCSSSKATVCSNINNFFKDCPAQAIAAAAWTEPDSISRIFGDESIPGYMEYRTYNPANQENRGYDIVFMPCKQGGPQILAALQAYVNGDAIAKDVLRASMIAAPGEKAKDGGGPLDVATTKTLVGSTAQKLQQALAYDQAVNYDVMVNMVFHRVVKAASTASTEVDGAHAARLFTTLMLEMRRKAVSDQAGQGSMFVSFMTQAMNAFSFLFAATAPIVILVAVVMGVGGFKVYGSWLLFGVWSQSWLPIATLISYYVETSFWNRLSDVGASGVLSLGGIDNFYEQVVNIIYTGSTMMSAVPIITLSLLSGSIYAMSSLAGKATGTDRDYMDEKRMPTSAHDAANADAYKQYATAGGGVFSASSGAMAGRGLANNAATANVYDNTAGHSKALSNLKAAQAVESRTNTEREAAQRSLQDAIQTAEHRHVGVGVRASSATGVKKDEALAHSTDNTQAKNNTFQTGNTQGINVGGSTSGLGGRVGAALGLTAVETESDIKGQVRGSSTRNGTTESTGAENAQSIDTQTMISRDSTVQAARQRLAAAESSHQKAVSRTQTAQEQLSRTEGSSVGLKANFMDLARDGLSGEGRAEVISNAMMAARTAARESGNIAAANRLEQAGAWESPVAIQQTLGTLAKSSDVATANAALAASAVIADAGGHHHVAEAMRNDIGINNTQQQLSASGTNAALGGMMNGDPVSGKAFGMREGMPSMPAPIAGGGSAAFASGNTKADATEFAKLDNPDFVSGNPSQAAVLSQMRSMGASPTGPVQAGMRSEATNVDSKSHEQRSELYKGEIAHHQQSKAANSKTNERLDRAGADKQYADALAKAHNDAARKR